MPMKGPRAAMRIESHAPAPSRSGTMKKFCSPRLSSTVVSGLRKPPAFRPSRNTVNPLTGIDMKSAASPGRACGIRVRSHRKGSPS